MTLRFKLETQGWMVAQFQQGEKVVKVLHADTYGDKFQELLNEFFIIYKHKSTDIPYSFTLKWNDYNLDYIWSISIPSIDTGIEIEITELSSTGGTHKEQTVSHTFPFDELFDAIYISLDEMLKAFGFIGYKENWEAGNFPIYEYLTLKSEKYKIELPKVTFEDVPEDQEDPNWRKKVSPADELRLITPSH